MKRLLAFVLACALGTAFGQTPPPNGQVSYLLSKSDVVTTFVDVSWSYDAGKPVKKIFYLLTCTNRCNGNKHFLHDNCDESCDSKCEVSHRGDLLAIGSDFGLSDISALSNALAQFGVQEDYMSMRILCGVRQEMKLDEIPKNNNYKLSYNFRHWNSFPCSYQARSFLDKDFNCTVTFSLKRETLLQDGTFVVTQGPISTFTFPVQIPIPGSITEPEKPVISCACSIVHQSDDKHSLLLDDNSQEVGVACVHGDETKLIGGEEIAAMGLTFVGEDMNNFTVTATNKPPNCTQVTIPAGFELVCRDGSAQDVLLVNDVTVQFARGSNVGLIANIDPLSRIRGWSGDTVEARTLCLNMAKREPSPSKEYFLAMPRDPVTYRIAQMTKQSRFKGPWDQVRLWIYTDNASLDETKKVLIPGPTPRMYLRELHTLVRERLFDLDPDQGAKIADNSLLTAYAPDEVALDWFVSWKLGHQRESTLKFVKSCGKALASHFDEGKPEDAAAGVCALVASLSAHGGDEGTNAGLDVLADKALVPHMKPISESPRFGELAWHLTRTTSAPVAERLLEFIRQYPSPSAKVACLNINKALPEEIKTKAAELAK